MNLKEGPFPRIRLRNVFGGIVALILTPASFTHSPIVGITVVVFAGVFFVTSSKRIQTETMQRAVAGSGVGFCLVSLLFVSSLQNSVLSYLEEDPLFAGFAFVAFVLFCWIAYRGGEITVPQVGLSVLLGILMVLNGIVGAGSDIVRALLLSVGVVSVFCEIGYIKENRM
ncbi:hypothetical protein AUR64_08165 [Haloprofundus marisrubri]|uniref:Uncharacterized protein n=1 Tax=Haloprofundus marisrubri TaxID=1514971 RepID=A0A0W1RB85_9EURY|nr:hypothetical protein [Haloprofundus marisrubri]KTG10630.1 hypothetical protein AUR64_08165 [Haloprofundus marisrubri]